MGRRTENRMPEGRLLLSFAAAAALLAACAEDERGEASGAPTEASARASGKVRWPFGPGLGPVLAALETGEADVARGLWVRATSAPTLERRVLLARIAALEGDGVAAIRELEEARRIDPRDPRVYATSAEIHAARGRLESAEAEIRAGLIAAGDAAPLRRARGVLLISRAGGARPGLRHLEEALELDPELPFVDRPLAQAHLLLGNLALAEGEGLRALFHAREALAHEPTARDVRTLAADAYQAVGELDAAIALYEELGREGVEMGGTLAFVHHRAGIAALLEERREAALEHFLAARDHGLSSEDLGFGRHVIQQAAAEALEEGRRALEEGRNEAAVARLLEAGRIDPDSRETVDQLGVAFFRAGDFERAAKTWGELLSISLEEGRPLDHPLHLDLARCWYQLERWDEVRATLAGYLEREPEGGFAEETREMLARLEARLDGGR